MLLLYLIILLFTGYSILVLYYGFAWQSIPLYQPSGKSATVKISVIIPARNEAASIGRLLTALQQQTYPRNLFEVIVIDDHSTDDTAAIVQQFSFVNLIRLREDALNSYKKKALKTGIAAATGELIVTTDADCLPPPGWLEQLASFREETKAVFIAAPVLMEANRSLLQIFQSMDFMVLQAITGAAVSKKQLSMCNGANLAYTREAFFKVGGFAGIDHIASGDDMLLMYKIARQYPGEVQYLKSNDAVVRTQPMHTWKEFINQRIRWASKAALYDDKRILPVLLLVYLVNLSFGVLLIAGFWQPRYWIWLLGYWVLKTLVELPLFASAAAFFEKKETIRYFFFFQPLHILYTILSGFLGQFGKYEWKGRKVS